MRAYVDVSHIFTRFAQRIARISGRPVTFVICCGVIAIWAISGPIFNYSDTWQLLINTGTTIVTFLMVFLIQNQQNRDGSAVQAKLDELLRALEGARNDYIGIERLTDEELEIILEEIECDVCGSDDSQNTRRKLDILRDNFSRLGRKSTK